MILFMGIVLYPGSSLIIRENHCCYSFWNNDCPLGIFIFMHEPILGITAGIKISRSIGIKSTDISQLKLFEMVHIRTPKYIDCDQECLMWIKFLFDKAYFTTDLQIVLSDIRVME